MLEEGEKLQREARETRLTWPEPFRFPSKILKPLLSHLTNFALITIQIEGWKLEYLPMVTDQELASCVETLLRQAGPAVSVSNISVPNLVRHLEAKLGLDLSQKEPFIRNQVTLLLSPQIQKDRFAPTFQQFQYRQHSNMAIAAAAAASASPYQGQQELSFKYHAAPELVGATATSSATSVKAKAEPLRDSAKPPAVAVAGTKERLVLYSLVLLGFWLQFWGSFNWIKFSLGKCLEECIWPGK